MTRKECRAYRKLINKIIIVKEKGDCCYECGNKFNYQHYEFHHTNPEEKVATVSSLLGNSLEVIREEADKCIVVCNRCHRLIHLRLDGYSDREIKEEVLADIIENDLDKYKNESGEIKYIKMLKELQA